MRRRCGRLNFRAVWAMRPRSALIAIPTFSEYEQALTACGCKIDYFELKAENGFQLTKKLLEHIQPQTDIVFLCNPNNPTGQLTSRSCWSVSMARCASCGALLVVDECFRDFLDEPMQNSMNGWVEILPQPDDSAGLHQSTTRWPACGWATVCAAIRLCWRG